MSRRLLAAIAMTALACCAAATARAAPVTDRVRRAGVVRCGGVIRPGLAFPGADRRWHGLEIEMCRAVAVAVLGPGGRSEFRPVAPELDMRAVADGDDDVAFLTGSEIVTDNLLGAVVPGPPVFFEPHGVMVPEEAKATRLADLRDTMICAEPGTGPERSLHAWFAARHIPFRFSMWQEAEEMMDAFDVGRCPAIAGEMTALAALKLTADAAGRPSRLLPDALAAEPVMATTPRGDADWSAIVAWTVQTVIGGGGGTGPGLPLAGPALGLDASWQANVVAAVGSYADIFRRSLGSRSPLDLPRGVNASWQDGGLLCPPVVE